MFEPENNFVRIIFKVNGDNILTFNHDLTKNELTYIKLLIIEVKKCDLSNISFEKIITDKEYSDISVTSNGDMVLDNLLENKNVNKITSFDYLLDYFHIVGLKDIQELINFK
jgi:hypothetical protein